MAPLPLWDETVKHLEQLLTERHVADSDPVFCARGGRPLTRFGIYKIIHRHAAEWDTAGPQPRRVSPHLFRHTAATHLLESGVEVNVIRGWLGHVSLDTTNRYAELMLRAKMEALRNCEIGTETSAAVPLVQSGRTTNPCFIGSTPCSRLCAHRPERLPGAMPSPDTGRAHNGDGHIIRTA